MADYEPSFPVAEVAPSFTLSVREDRVYTGAGVGRGVDKYTLRLGDRLLVIDNTGKIVGLPPDRPKDFFVVGAAVAGRNGSLPQAKVVISDGAEGDLILLFVAMRSSAPTNDVLTPDGYTSYMDVIVAGMKLRVFARLAEEAEGSLLTVSMNVANHISVSAVRLRGVTSIAEISVPVAGKTAPSVTAPSKGILLAWWAGRPSVKMAATPPAPMLLAAQHKASGACASVAYVADFGPGSSGARTAKWSGGMTAAYSAAATLHLAR